MELNSLEDIALEFAKLEEEEDRVRKKLKGYVSKQYQLEAMLKNITKSIPKLQEIARDADKLSLIINQTASLAENVSDKVRRLDITRCRVSDCQQRVHDLLDLQLCSEGVTAALKAEDYEKAAGHVHRFLSIDQAILKQTAADFAEDETSVDNSFSLLQDVTEKLRVVVAKKMNEAIVEKDLASVERFFKIHPLLNTHEEGIAKYALFLSTKLKETSKKNLETAIKTNQLDRKPNIIFADTLNSLLEGSARIIETCQPLIDTYYGSFRMILFIRHIQTACDSESDLVISELIRSRQIDRKIQQANDYLNNTKTVEKLDSKSIAPLLAELTSMLSKTDLYFKFLKRRAIICGEENLQGVKEINDTIDRCLLNRRMQEILGYYVLLERFFLEESVNRAISMDDLLEGELHISSMVDDVFFIVKKAIERSCTSGSLEGVCTVLNDVCRLLETEYCPALKQQLRQGYPSGYLDLTQAYNALQQGRLQTADPEQTKLSFLAYLNNADVSLEYTEALKTSIEAEINAAFPKMTNREKEKVEMCLSALSTVSKCLNAVIDYGMKQLKDSAIRPRVNPWINTFLDRNHKMTEDEFSNYESGETFMQKVIGNIGSFLSSFKGTLTSNNYDALVNALTTEVAKQLEKVMMKVEYNRLGALLVDRELRGIIAFLTAFTSWSIRDKFERLIQMSMLINADNLSDISEMSVNWTPEGRRLDIKEIRKVLKRRCDFNSLEIDALKL